MCDAGSPFLLKGFGVLGHILFINSGCAKNEFKLNKSTQASKLLQSFSWP